MRRLFTATAQHDRIEALRDHLDPEALGQLVVAPTRAAGDAFVRELEGEGARLGLHRLGVWALSLELSHLELARRGLAPTTGLAAEATAARAVARARPKLTVLAAVADTPGFARTLLQTLRDVRRHLVTPEALEQAGPHGPDLARLLTAHRAVLLDEGLADEVDVLEAAARGASGAHRWAGLPLLLLDVGPADPAEAHLWSALVAQAPEVTAVIGPHDPRRARLAQTLGVEAEPLDVPEPETSLERARAFVFREAAPEPMERDETLWLGSAPGEARECVEVARRVLHHAREGIPFDEMAVLLRSPERYLQPLKAAFERAQIPLWLTRAARAPDPSGRAFLALLACAAEQLSARRFAEYLSLGEVPEPAPDGAPPRKEVQWVTPKNERQLSFISLEPEPAPDPLPEPPRPDADTAPVVDGRLRAPDRWEELLVEASVVGGGPERWASRLEGLRKELSAQIQALEASEPERAGHARRELEALEHLARFAVPLVRELAELPRTATWGEWLPALENLASMALRAPTRPLQALAELRVLSEVGPLGLDEVRLVLHERMSFLRQPDEEDQPYGQVLVGSLDDASGRSFSIVLCPGLAEGGFPQTAREDPLLLDRDRAPLAADLPRRPRFVAEERARLLAGLGAAREAFEVSYPRLDTEKGRPRSPSFYVLDLLRAAEGRLPGIKALERAARAATADRLGWPAPEAPERALDPIEHDLAVIAEAGGELDGLGAYLMDPEAPGHQPILVRALRSRAGRWRSDFTPSDGFVGFAEQLAAHRLRARPYSASALQRFAACPYQFYLYALLRLRPREEPIWIERMDPRMRGNLAHEILFRWMQRARREDLLPWTVEDLDALLELLSDEARSASSAWAEQLAPAIPAVWQRETAELERDLRRWVERTVLDDDGFSPEHAELAFGLPADREGGADPDSAPEPVEVLGRLSLRGSIDLVEQDPVRGHLRITDYKTGRAPKAADGPSGVGGGQVLQPILYAQATEGLLGRPADRARLAFCTSRGGFRSDYFDVGPEARERLSVVLDVIDESVERGFLPAAPEDGACGRCDFRPICGTMEPTRISRKKKDALVRLNELRNLP